MIEITSLDLARFRAEDQVVAAVGFFDGLHLAHQEIIRVCRDRAQQRGGLSVVFTFQNHPAAVLAPDRCPTLITPYALKRAGLERLGVDTLVAVPFDLAFSRITAEAFIRDILAGLLHAREIVVGFNFHFGHARQGTPERLEQAVPECFEHVWIIPPHVQDDQPVSSTRIRKEILQGRLDWVAQGLGRDFQIAGDVIRGDERGRSFGFPTANLDVHHQVLPPHGVYGVRVCIGSLDGEPHWGVMNVGVLPTFGEKPVPTVEIHLLDFHGDLYGQWLIADVLHLLRPERKFDGVQELTEQIHNDIAAFRAWLPSH